MALKKKDPIKAIISPRVAKVYGLKLFFIPKERSCKIIPDPTPEKIETLLPVFKNPMMPPRINNAA